MANDINEPFAPEREVRRRRDEPYRPLGYKEPTPRPTTRRQINPRFKPDYGMFSDLRPPTEERDGKTVFTDPDFVPSGFWTSPEFRATYAEKTGTPLEDVSTLYFSEEPANRAALENMGYNVSVIAREPWVQTDLPSQVPGAGHQMSTGQFDINAWQALWDQAQGRRGPGNVLQRSNTAAQQRLWAEELRRRAVGETGPSPAELQMRAAQDAQARQALSLARSARGVSPGMALRQAQQAQGQMAAQTAQQTAILRAQETQAAGQAYQQALQAGMSHDMAMNQARLAQRQIHDAWQQFGVKGQQAEDRYNQLTQLQIEAMNRGDTREAARLAVDRERLAAQLKLARQGRSDALLGGVLSTGAQVAIAALLND